MAERAQPGRFLDDLAIPGLNYAVTVRSPSARGRLVALEIPELPSGYAAVRAGDIPGQNRLSALGSSLPILADGEVRYAGEPVAIIAGPNRSVLEHLRDRTVVTVEEGKPLFGWEKFSGEQIIRKRIMTLGNPEEAFSAAARVMEGSYRTGSQYHGASEPQGAIAIPGTEGAAAMLVHASTQWPFHVRDTVAEILALDRKDVVVRAADIGFHLDSKLWFPSLVAAHAALAARVLGKPVKLLYTRQEDFSYGPKRAPTLIRHRSALDERGNLIGAEIQIIVNMGAYGPLSEELVDRMCMGAAGAYTCGALQVETFAVSTNLPPMGAFSGLGLSQTFFAAETHATRISDFSQRDPVEWRLANLLKRDTPLVTGEPFPENVPSREILDRIVSMSDFRRKYAAYGLLKAKRAGRTDGPMRGIGVGFCFQGNGLVGDGEQRTPCSVELTLDKESRLSIRTSAVSGSPTTTKIWKSLAGSILSIPEDQVTLEPVSTDSVPNSGPSTLSRNITVITRLVERCCHAIQKQRFRDPLPITVRRSYRVPGSQHWDSSLMHGSPFAVYSWAGAVVEVLIDPIILEPRVKHVWLCVDGGTILSRERARQVLEANSVTALGWAAREAVTFADGRVDGRLFYHYRTPSMDELPELDIDFIEHDRKEPIKGLGDLPYGCIPAAYCAAVSQAAGSTFASIPLAETAVTTFLEEE